MQAYTGAACCRLPSQKWAAAAAAAAWLRLHLQELQHAVLAYPPAGPSSEHSQSESGVGMRERGRSLLDSKFFS